MNILNKRMVASAFILLLASASAFANNDKIECPTHLVNFWKTFAMQTENPDAIPGFLLSNECFRATTSPEFYELALKRLDHPENAKLVGQLYSELTWTNGYTYE